MYLQMATHINLVLPQFLYLYSAPHMSHWTFLKRYSVKLKESLGIAVVKAGFFLTFLTLCNRLFSMFNIGEVVAPAIQEIFWYLIGPERGAYFCCINHKISFHVFISPVLYSNEEILPEVF